VVVIGFDFIIVCGFVNAFYYIYWLAFGGSHFKVLEFVEGADEEEIGEVDCFCMVMGV
jgi:hypothetical protein